MKTNLTQSEEFKIVWEFFARHATQVEARGSEELLPEQKIALAALASGKADNQARTNLIPLLRSNRNALSFLADQIKVARPGTTRKQSSPKTNTGL
jgi:hypothetical protein